MAIAVQLDFPGATLEQYDQVVEKMGLQPGGATPPDALFHWVTKTDEGIRVIDVWESRSSFDRYSQEKIGPMTQAVGMTTPPAIQFFDVHNYLTGGS